MNIGRIALAIILATTIPACGKKGETGPAGPQGTTGVPGTPGPNEILGFAKVEHMSPSTVTFGGAQTTAVSVEGPYSGELQVTFTGTYSINNNVTAIVSPYHTPGPV